MSYIDNRLTPLQREAAERERAESAEAALAEEKTHAERWKATAVRMRGGGPSLCSRLHPPDDEADCSICFPDIQALADEHNRLKREAWAALAECRGELEEARKALVEAVIPLEVIAGQHRTKPYKELSASLIEQVNRSIAAVRQALSPASRREDAGPAEGAVS